MAGKIGGKKIIHSQAREVIFNVYNFMKREVERGEPILFGTVQKRVAEAVGISRSSVQRILKESQRNVAEGQAFATPRKLRKRKRKIDLDMFDKCVIRRTVNEFHKEHGERPTLKKLLPVVKEKIEFNGGKTALWKEIRNLGFKWKKSCDNRKVLIEKPDIREKRVQYLRAIKRYRQENRPIVYQDETYVHSSHTKPNSWTDESTSGGLKTPVSKGQYAIIVHAGSEQGFVPNAMLIFKSGQKSGDYHESMNFNNYNKWLREKLIPNLPEKSVLVIDNASYHNKQINPAPTSSTKKCDMISWLHKNNVPFGDKMLKPELYQLIKLNKNRTKMFKIDALLAEHGHSVIRLPPYHPDLNPIELIWASIKEHVAQKNVTFKLDDCIALVKEKVNLLNGEDWLKRCEHALRNEDQYLSIEPHIDELSDRIIIHLGDDSSSSEDSDDDSTSSGSDGELSGVDLL